MSARRYRFGPLEQRAVVGPLRIGQVLVVAAGGAARPRLALRAAELLGPAASGCWRSARPVAAIFVPLEGRTAGGVGAGRAALGAAVARASAATARRRSGPAFAPAPTARREHESSLPPELAGIELLAVPYGSEQVGVIRDRARRHLHRGAGGAGRRLRRCATPPSRSESSTPGARCWRAARATAARSAACSGSSAPCPARAMSSPPTCRPSATARVAARLQPGPLLHRADRVGGARSTQEHEILLALQIDQRRGARELRRLGGGERGGLRAALARGREPRRAAGDRRGDGLRACCARASTRR